MTDNPRLGITLMILTTLVFATQDGFSRLLADKYNVMVVVLFRYWFFAAFVIALSASRAGGVARVARSNRPGLQIFRGVLLVGEICVMVLAFVRLGLVEAHAIFAFFCALMVLQLLFVMLIMPETRGRSLESLGADRVTSRTAP